MERMREQLGELRESLGAATTAAAARAKETAVSQSSLDTALGELQATLALYGRLGLRFDRTCVDGEDLLQLIFTQIDSKRPTAEFMFAVHVSEADMYKGTTVHCPPAPPFVPVPAPCRE